MDAHQRDLSPREPVNESLCLDFGLVLGEGVGIRWVDGVVFVDWEERELERLIRIRQTDGVDAGRVADLLDTELAAGTEAVECAVDVVGVDFVVGCAYGVGDRSEVDDGVAAFEGLDGCVVVGCCVCGAHLGVLEAVVFLIGAIDLHCCVSCFGA